MIKLSTIFTSHMVLQREMPIRVFGEGTGSVSVTFMGETKQVTSCGEKWEIEFPAMNAGGPYTMEIVADGEKTVLEDILVGDVWLCGGQSNMEHALCRTDRGMETAENCRNENIRFFTVPRRTQKDVAVPNWHFYYSDNEDTPWEICDTQSAMFFSAIGFYFAKNVYNEIGVPIGMINCNWGGTQIEPYIEESICRSTPAIQPVVALHDASLAEIDNEKYEVDYKKFCDRQAYYMKNVRGDTTLDVREMGLRAAELKVWNDPEGIPMPYGKYHPTMPGILYNAMVARITPFALKGVLWYQGESNAHSGCEKHSIHRDGYDEKYAALMKCWRESFKCPDLPFYAVELAPYKTYWDGTSDDSHYTWAYLREMQMNAAKLENSYLVTAQDKDDGFSIHPTNKDVVGDRISACALRNTYKRNNFPLSPSYKSAEFKDGKAYITFDNSEGLMCSHFNPHLRICGEDRVFRQGYATVCDGKLVVWNGDVKDPVAVRYCYSDYFIGTVFNGDGMPAHPFRTDDFDLFDK